MGIVIDIFILTALILILALAVAAIGRGLRGIKNGKLFETADKKIKIGYMAASVVHMLAGIGITICYLIAGVLILLSL